MFERLMHILSKQYGLVGSLFGSLFALLMLVVPCSDAWAEDPNTEESEVERWVQSAMQLRDMCSATEKPEFCNTYCGEDKNVKIDVCAFTDPLLVAVGLEVAPGDMHDLRKEVWKAAKNAESRFTEDPEQRSLLDALIAGLVPGGGAVAGAAGLGTAESNVTALLQRGLGALARVISDRAKREAVGWLLDDVASELCEDPQLNIDEEIKAALDEKIKAALEEVIKDFEGTAASKFQTAFGLEADNSGETAWIPKECRKKVQSNKSAKNASILDTFTKDDKRYKRYKTLVKEYYRHIGYGADAEISVVRSELRNHWMPNLCSLARNERLDHYGAGAALLEALQGALENDLRGWPGVLAGTGLGEFHWLQTNPKSLQLAMVACADESKANDPSCEQVTQLRRAGERFVERLLDGRDPAVASRDLGTAISSAVVGDKGDVTDAPLELLACSMSLPGELALLEPKFRAQKVDRAMTAAILAGLVRAPACWELTGMGYETINPGANEMPELARKHRGTSRERISTILRLAKQVQTLERVQVEFEVLRKALAELDAARNGKTKVTGEERARSIFLATMGVVDSSLGSADALLVAVARFSDITQTFPGIIDDKHKPDVTEFLEEIEKVREEIATLRDLSKALQGFGTGEYSKAITMSATLVLAQFERVCATAAGDGRELCQNRVDIVGRHVGTITALLTAKDADDMASAIDAAANPPGGWRSKGEAGNVTVALTAYPGVYGAAEWRRGQYGAVNEVGGAYFQAPTIAMPFGVDVVWGTRCPKSASGCTYGVFFPVIDPAAFLQYDVTEGGKLPGPRPVTALSPGIVGRIGIPKTPLAVLLSVIYRPQFRSWEATVSGPGANVFQLGLSVAMDVTLWKIFARGK